MNVLTEREILASVFGKHAVDRLEAHAPYDQVDSSDVLTPVNRDARCALSELGDGAGFTVTASPATEPLIRIIVDRYPSLMACANDVGRSVRAVMVANDGGQFRSPGGVRAFLDRQVDVSQQLARFVRDRRS